MKISIIIPALNEEKLLPLLLNSIKNQKTARSYEIIVADGGSSDNTVKIAKAYGCKVVEGGLPGRARNKGEAASSGDLLFFIDADIVLPDNFFEKSLKEFKEKELELASFNIKTFPENKFIDSLMNLFYNKPMVVLEDVFPHAAAVIMANRTLFEKLGGYDETILLAEDHDLARRAKKIAKIGIIKSAVIYASDRRVKTDGWLKTGVKFLLCELHMIFIGPVKTDIFKYRFDHYRQDEPKAKNKN